MKKVLKQIAYQLEALSISVAALEAASLSDTLGGRQLTDKQLSDLKKKAKKEQKVVFDDLHNLIRDLKK